jgi:hypothetical protein
MRVTFMPSSPPCMLLSALGLAGTAEAQPRRGAAPPAADAPASPGGNRILAVVNGDVVRGPR